MVKSRFEGLIQYLGFVHVFPQWLPRGARPGLRRIRSSQAVSPVWSLRVLAQTKRSSAVISKTHVLNLNIELEVKSRSEALIQYLGLVHVFYQWPPRDSRSGLRRIRASER